MQDTFSSQRDMPSQYMCTELSEATTALRLWACHSIDVGLAQGKQPSRASLSMYMQNACTELHHRAKAFTPRSGLQSP